MQFIIDLVFFVHGCSVGKGIVEGSKLARWCEKEQRARFPLWARYLVVVYAGFMWCVVMWSEDRQKAMARKIWGLLETLIEEGEALPWE